MNDDLQRTEQWHADRCGKFTGSRFVDVLARNKRTGEKLKAWHSLCWQVACERLTGIQEEGPDGFALKWGREVEPFAAEAYEFETGNIITPTGFIAHPDYLMAGCSPDGLVGTDGGLEMKSPKSSLVHLERLVSGIPDEHIPQVQGCMWVTGRAWWDFVSYDPRMPEEHRIFIQRIERDESYIKALAEAVLEAEARVQEILDQLAKRVA